MEKLMRRSSIEMTPQAKRNLQDLFINFSLILICLLLLYVVVRIM